LTSRGLTRLAGAGAGRVILWQHRSSNSFLYQRLREARGLNYGDYAYIEYFRAACISFSPIQTSAGSSKYFRYGFVPSSRRTATSSCAARFTNDKLVREGMSREAFESTREFLTKYVNVLTATQDAQLGYEMDSRYYHIPNFNTYMRDQLAKLTLEDVNRAIQKYLKRGGMRIAIITKDASGCATPSSVTGRRRLPTTLRSPKTSRTRTS